MRSKKFMKQMKSQELKAIVAVVMYQKRHIIYIIWNFCSLWLYKFIIVRKKIFFNCNRRDILRKIQSVFMKNDAKSPLCPLHPVFSPDLS